MEHINGRKEYHSAYLALYGDINVIKRRIWTAQVRVLLPFIEIQRQEILNRFDSYLKIGVIKDDIQNFEIGKIWHVLNNNPKVIMDKATRRLLDALKEARNALAHIDPIDKRIFRQGIFEDLPW